MKPKADALAKITDELDSILKEWVRVNTILKDATISQQKKQKIDQDRWKRKFKTLFDLNKNCICFDSIESSNTFAKSGIITSLELKAKNETGQQLMSTSSKFWVLFANYVRTKLESCIDSKEKVRR